jgi:DNA-binding FrmR family transcriptional regulator
MKARAHADECTHEEPALDAADKEKLLGRLRRIEGQVRGLHRMIEEDRYCADILVQISAVQASLRSASQVLLQGHLRRCVTDAVRSDDAARTEKVFAELVELLGRYGR